MRQNCKNCGNRFEGSVCPECGTKADSKAARREQAAQKFETEGRPLSQEERSKNKKALIVLCVLGALFVVFVLWRNGFIGAGKFESVAESYFESICERDFDKFVACQPEEIARSHRGDLEDSGLEKTEFMSVLYADFFEEFGEDMTVTVDIGSSKAVEQVYINYFLESYVEIYGVEPKYSSFLELDVSATFSGSNSTDTILLDCFMMKSQGKWYVVGCEYVTEEVTE
ncbi:MAG: hypothetical protein IJ424_02850 [Oscillospiraceae bacterium]|nr:hypothetical protein [Oscillospiraceae bacterium]